MSYMNNLPTCTLTWSPLIATGPRTSTTKIACELGLLKSLINNLTFECINKWKKNKELVEKETVVCATVKLITWSLFEKIINVMLISFANLKYFFRKFSIKLKSITVAVGCLLTVVTLLFGFVFSLEWLSVYANLRALHKHKREFTFIQYYLLLHYNNAMWKNASK